MGTWLFWGLAAVAIVAALLVVAQRSATRAIVMVAVVLGAVSGLSLVLLAPVAAIVLVACAGALVALAWPVTFWLEPPVESDSGAGFTAGAGPRRCGVLLAIGLIVELAWAFQQVRGTMLPPAEALPARGIAVVGRVLATDYADGVLLVVLLVLAAVAGGAALLPGREVR